MRHVVQCAANAVIAVMLSDDSLSFAHNYPQRPVRDDGICQNAVMLPSYGVRLRRTCSPLNPDYVRAPVAPACHFARVPSGTQSPRFRFVDYRDLATRQLGSIYEGLLEYRLARATEKMVVARKNKRDMWGPESEAGQVNDDAERCEPGDLYPVTDRGERKATGSYYTPDFIVRYITSSRIHCSPF